MGDSAGGGRGSINPATTVDFTAAQQFLNPDGSFNGRALAALAKKGKGGGGAGGPATQQGQVHYSRRQQAPVLLLSINDKPANDLLRITTSFTHKRSIGKSAETKWVFRNDDRTLCDDPRMFPNTEWKFRFGFTSGGFANDISAIKQGFIREVAPVYDQKRTVTITLYDALLNMSTKSSGKNWGRIQASDIARALAKKHNFLFAGDDSKDVPKKAWIQPSDVNDVRYLRDLAAQTDFEVFVDGSPPTLFFRKKPYGNSPKAILIYYNDPTEFSFVKRFAPKVKSLGPMQAGVTGTDAEKGKGDKKTSGDPSKNGPALSVYIAFGDVGPSSSFVAASSAVKKDVSTHAPAGVNTAALVAASRQQMLDKSNEATSDHPLTASITVGDIYQWGGLEKQLNGNWYAFEEHHELSGSGSSTKIIWKRNTTGQGAASEKAKNTNSSSTSGAGGTPAKVVYVYANTGSGETVVIPPGNPPPPIKSAPTPAR
jgi:phage protein D